MLLNLLETEKRFIVDPARPDAPFELPPLFFGDQQYFGLRVFRKGRSGLYCVDVSGYQTTMLLGQPNTRPRLGFWQITTALGTSAAIPSQALAQDVATALQTAFGPGATSVTGGNGSYIVTLTQPGVWTLPTASFQGNTLSNVLVFQVTAGTTTTPAQYRVEVLEVAPARVVPIGWTPGNTIPQNSFLQLAGTLWQLNLDPTICGGFFTLTVDGITTDYISWFAGAYQVSQALAAIGKTATAQSDDTGGFWIQFAATVTTASIGGNLIILPYLTGYLDLTSTGVRELLDGLQYNSVKLTVSLFQSGKTVTVASADVMLQMPVNQPATVTIDAPQMAGLTFAISSDMGYMHVYQNGLWLYDIPLNNPTPGGGGGQQPSGLSFQVSDDRAYLHVYQNNVWLYDIFLNVPES